MKDKIIDIIVKVTYDTRVKEENDIDLIKSGILDSLGFINLISALEDEFNIEIQPTQIPSSTWRHVDSIVNLVKEKLGVKC